MKNLMMSLFLLLSCRPSVYDEIALTGFWLPEMLEWESPPPDQIEGIEGTRFVYTSTFYFSTDGSFRMMNWLLYKSSLDSLNVGVGDGFSVFEGIWRRVSDKEVLIKFRVVYRSIEKVGEKLPGEEIKNTLSVIKLNNSVLKLRMNDKVFIKSTMLTSKSKEFLLNPHWSKLLNSDKK